MAFLSAINNHIDISCYLCVSDDGCIIFVFFSSIRDDVEKEDAFRGLCAMVESSFPLVLCLTFNFFGGE